MQQRFSHQAVESEWPQDPQGFFCHRGNGDATDVIEGDLETKSFEKDLKLGQLSKPT